MSITYEFNKRRDKAYLWIARRLPKRLLMWCFVLVYGDDGEAPGPCYGPKMDHWCDKYGIKD